MDTKMYKDAVKVLLDHMKELEEKQADKQDKSTGKGVIEITFEDDAATIRINGSISLANATIALGSVMGNLVKDESQESVKGLLDMFVAALVDTYKEEGK